MPQGAQTAMWHSHGYGESKKNSAKSQIDYLSLRFRRGCSTSPVL